MGSRYPDDVRIGQVTADVIGDYFGSGAVEHRSPAVGKDLRSTLGHVIAAQEEFGEDQLAGGLPGLGLTECGPLSPGLGGFM
jgi:hypothetical protein